MTRIILSILIVGLAASAAQALPGPAPLQSAIGEYIIQTGEIYISTNQVKQWSLISFTQGLTGNAPTNFPSQNSNLAGFTDNDSMINEAVIQATIGFTNLDLGPVAETNLPADDLILSWKTSDGNTNQIALSYISVPELPTIVLAMLGILGSVSMRFRIPL
jgi:hypothetical protein